MQSYLRFLYIAFKTNLKISLSRRTDFIISFVTISIIQACFLTAWKTFFSTYESLNGWTFRDMMLMYGCTSTSIGIAEMVFFGLREIPKIVETGQLDVFLMQPKNIILKVAMSKSHIPAIAEGIVGMLIIYFSGYLIMYPLQIALILFSGIFFFSAILMYIGSLVFFVHNSEDIVKEMRSAILITAAQPNSAYSGYLKYITFSILPVAYWSFFPVEYIRTGDHKFLIITLVGTTVFFVTAITIFNYSLRRYESSSNMAIRF